MASPHAGCVNPALLDPWKRYDPSEIFTGPDWMTDDYLADFCRQKWHQIGQISGREQLEYSPQDDKTSGAAAVMDHLRGHLQRPYETKSIYIKPRVKGEKSSLPLFFKREKCS